MEAILYYLLESCQPNRKLYGIFTFQKNLGNFTKDFTKIHDIKHHKIDLMDSEGYHFVY